MSAAGRTEDAGWELGVRRTTSASPDRAWDWTGVVERLLRDLDAESARI